MRFKLAAFADEADGRISEQIKAMRDNGVDYLEIRGVDGENISDISLDKAREVRRQLDDAGLAVWSLGSPYGKTGICDDFSAHLGKFKHGLELAEVLGAKHIRMFSFYVPSDDAERYRDVVMSRLEQFICAAEGSGIILCHENEKGIYGDIASRCEEIHKEFPQLKAVFDPANFIQCGQDTKEAWEKLSAYVEYMHIKDATSDGSVVPAGKGTGNLPYLLEQYKGSVLTLEPHLSVFDGFDKLEAEEKTKMGYCYPSSRAAFDAAVNALKELI
ncbi:MAG: sugar phosphate isomerase/epimerase [Oscillospiraceae bacterium]|nr:sugar phosphate isomerase/epimerase [Oscillospiraceae bacterium]